MQVDALEKGEVIGSTEGFHSAVANEAADLVYDNLQHNCVDVLGLVVRRQVHSLSCHTAVTAF